MNALDARIDACFVGKFRPTALARFMADCQVFPSTLEVGIRRRNWRQVGQRVNGVRPYLRCEWHGEALRGLLDVIGWQTGKPALDQKILAYRRWLDYRETSKAWTPPRNSS